MTRWNPSPELLELLVARTPEYAEDVQFASEQWHDWLVVLKSGKGRFALMAVDVRRVVQVRGRVPLPGAPAHLLGLIPADGDITPLISVGRLLGDESATDIGPEAVIVGEAEERLAVLSEQIVEVVRDPGTGAPPGMGESWIERVVPNLASVLRIDNLVGLAIPTESA
jgi:chemotaxis signal transduction protein